MAAISSTSYFSSQPQLPASSGANPASTSGGSNGRQRTGSCVMLEAASGGGAVGRRTRSLTEEDLEELKGCLDLGFGFSYHQIPGLCGTLPGLELSYSMTRRFLDEQSAVVGQPEPAAAAAAAPPIPDWKISGPGDDPDQVKARLKYWAQTVACTVKLCS
ncbi:uncharacterized protein LOC123445052 [Hordeum vulgare subsp. vulgare]|uniref:Uncharacterized protein n=1 Tax=Hordeum vulgare subsp. vulgare TaxID=112509 RepID=A0A8I6XA47_HORVV|nr:uncharacterized protein LOC123445052 [Hordeum vulgare subsp. vulgare]